MAEEKKSPINVKESTNEWKPPSFMNDALNDDGDSFLIEKKRQTVKVNAKIVKLLKAKNLNHLIPVFEQEKISLDEVIEQLKELKELKQSGSDNNDNKNINCSRCNNSKTIVVITKKEEVELEKINIALKKSNNINAVFEAHSNETKQHSETIISAVNQKFNEIFKELQLRQKVIINKIKEWKSHKLEEINNSISNIIKYNDGLKQTKKEIYDLLSKDGMTLKEREKNVNEMTDKLCVENEYFERFNDIKLLEKYINDNTKLLNVRFQESIPMNKLDEFGEINIDELNENYTVPTIQLSDIQQSYDDNGGYIVKLQWKISSKQEENDQFMVQYMEYDDTLNTKNDDDDDDDDDDEKNAVNTNNDGNGEWNILNDIEIKSLDDNTFGVDVVFNKHFDFYKSYKLRIVSMIKKPMNMMIISNIKHLKAEQREYHRHNTMVHNYNVTELIKNGWKCIYDKPYSHYTTTAEITGLCGNNKNIEILVGGAHKDNKHNIVLGAFGPSSVLHRITNNKNTAFIPEDINDENYKIYWYHNTESGIQSFGFSSKSQVKCGNADYLAGDDNDSLSWHTTESAGGYRLGSNTSLDASNDYYKIVYIKQYETKIT